MAQQPINLYFPQSWLEQASRDTEYALYTDQVDDKLIGYLRGIDAIDHDAYAWAVFLAGLNLGRSWTGSVPAWVYTHQRDPSRHDYRVFDGTEGQYEQGNNRCTSWEDEA